MDRQLPGRRRHCSPHRFDHVVIGAGVIGASVAQQLARRGSNVLVLDSAPAIAGGCSYANAALLAPGHVGPLATPRLLREAAIQMIRRPPAVRVRPELGLARWMGRLLTSTTPRRSELAGQNLRALAEQSTQQHVELAAQGLNPTLKKTGSLDVYLRKPRSRFTGLLEPDALDALEPSLSGVMAGSHDPEEWTVESRSFVQAMLDDAAAHGADVRLGTAAGRILTRGPRIEAVEIARGRIPTAHVIVAAGLRSAQLVAPLGLNLPMRGGRGYVVDLAPPQVNAPRMPIRIKEHRVVVTPLDDRVRVCGTIEFGGSRRPVDLHRSDPLLGLATRVLPSLEGQPVIERWSGERPCTADGIPIVGTSSLVPNLSLATGHGMWGMILAPATASSLATLIVDGVVDPCIRWMSPDRFNLRGNLMRRPSRR